MKIVGSTNQPVPHSSRSRWSAAQTADRAFFFGDADVVENLFVLRARGNGTDLRGSVERIAHARGLGESEQALDELRVNRAMDQRARARDAGLAGGREDSRHHAFHGLIEIGVVENNIGRFAAELERHVLDAARGQPIDMLARLIAAGEGDLGDVLVRDQRLAHFVAEAGDDVDNARRKARLLEQLAERERRDRGKFRRLPHHGVARGQRRRQFPCRQQQRRVPRRDGGHDAQRLLAREVEHTRLVDRNHAAFDLVRQAAVVVKPLRDVVELAAHLGDQLAVVGGFDLGQPLGFSRDQIAEFVQQRAARRRGQLAPLAMKRALRGSDGLIHIRFRAARNQRPRFRRERIHRFEPFTRGGIHPLAADQHLMLLHAARPPLNAPISSCSSSSSTMSSMARQFAQADRNRARI